MYSIIWCTRAIFSSYFGPGFPILLFESEMPLSRRRVVCRNNKPVLNLPNLLFLHCFQIGQDLSSPFQILVLLSKRSSCLLSFNLPTSSHDTYLRREPCSPWVALLNWVFWAAGFCDHWLTLSASPALWGRLGKSSLAQKSHVRQGAVELGAFVQVAWPWSHLAGTEELQSKWGCLR